MSGNPDPQTETAALLREYVRSRRFRWRVWKSRQAWIPQRRLDGMSVRRQVWWRWLGREWFRHYVETEADYQKRRQRFEEFRRRAASSAGGR